jgi:hypothetical protein
MLKSKYVPVFGLLLSTLVWNACQAPAQQSSVAQAPSASGDLLAAHTVQGGEVSGGADHVEIQPAFFLSNDSSRKINLCYEVAPDFGVPEEELQSVLKWSFSEWDSYLDKKGLRPSAEHMSDVAGYSIDIVGKLGEIHKGCAGGEDLRVFFGVNHPDVARFRPRYSNPFAFTAITEMGHEGKGHEHYSWSKGILWVAAPGEVEPEKGIPTWTKTNPAVTDTSPSHPEALPAVPYSALKYVLLHEVGHIFGTGHVEDTIMTSKIGENLNRATDPNWKWSAGAEYLRIDQDRELVPNLNLDAEYSFYNDYIFQEFERVFERLFGVAPAGAVTKVTAKRLGTPRWNSSGWSPDPDHVGEGGTNDLQLAFSVGEEVHQVKLVTTSRVGLKKDSTPVFRGLNTTLYNSFGASFYGYIIASGDRKIRVIVNYNMNFRLEIREIEEGQPNRPLLKTAVF